jgi:outer membrane protein OmpA-like peptidoglycan-associated protein
MSSNKETHWIPLADLMTVLMIMFLFLAVLYMSDVQENQQNNKVILNQYESTKNGLYKDLDSVFRDDFKRWNLKLDKDLSIKFINPQVLFIEGSYEVTPYFKSILVEFLPKYFSVVTKKQYDTSIAEIRVEGHTDTTRKTKDSYIGNMELSQNRARNVLAFIREQDCFRNLPSEKKELLQFLLTANGLSYGRTVDKNYDLTIYSKQPIDPDKSRRVEFRIVTKTDQILQQAINNIK